MIKHKSQTSTCPSISSSESLSSMMSSSSSCCFWLLHDCNLHTNPTILYTHIQYHGQDRLCQLCKCFVVAVDPLYQTRPINDHVDGVRIASAGDTFFSSSMESAALFVFRRDPSAFACVHGSGPSGWDQTSFMLTFLLSATRFSWLKRFSFCLQNHILAFHSGCLCADC